MKALDKLSSQDILQSANNEALHPHCLVIIAKFLLQFLLFGYIFHGAHREIIFGLELTLQKIPGYGGGAGG